VEATHPLREASGGKPRKWKPQESEISSGTPYKMFIERKGDEKASKMKGRVERQQKSLEAVEKKEKSGGQRMRQGEN
jgi:hypothetical protein